jgi:hypothetical protein
MGILNNNSVTIQSVPDITTKLFQEQTHSNAKPQARKLADVQGVTKCHDKSPATAQLMEPIPQGKNS